MTKVSDPYRWLEDPDAPETKKFVDLQNDVTQPYLEGCSAKLKIKEKLTQMWDFPKYGCPSKHGDRYFYFMNTGLQNHHVLYKQESLGAESSVFLDPNEFSPDGTVALSGTAFSEDGATLAYGVAKSGSDWKSIKFRKVDTVEDYPEELKNVKFSSMAWTHDHNGIFYGRYPHATGADGTETEIVENMKLYYHQLGTSQEEDILVIEFPDEPKWMIGATVSDCGQYLFVTPHKDCRDNLLYFADLTAQCGGPGKGPTGPITLTPVVTKFEADFAYVTNTGSRCVFRTNKDSPNYRLIIIDMEAPEEAKWETLVAGHEVDVLDWAAPIHHDKLVLCYMQDVKVYREVKVGDVDTSDLTTKQVFYSSKDGSKIPMFIVMRKNMHLDGSTPCLLYGYGGFNISVLPSFSVTRLAFIKFFNGVVAVANIRGGGEYGEKWHNAGRLLNKQNGFDDFIAAAEYLIKEGYTLPQRLTIMGGSNGGFLVGACTNQRPDLFGAAIAQVGVMDLLRFHRFTIGYAWVSDYGNPEESEEHFANLLSLSPLHNIKTPPNGVQYPAILLLTADHDDRVVPLHSLKYIAELQHVIGKRPQQKNPLMIRVDVKAGHGGGKPTTKVIEEYTDIMCFVMQALNLDIHV
ncbi:unnamed protein product [Darwinula stevensoni]|uniref:Prolyl endopeptidase n=1 Tax=Darwinula stevensoni TaxID=69355 RepID=A0A7R9FPB9_9CRUS|nr:unnamed protein product [Darwinula stevensoni]CAG0897700.1 unnamed protein product [Darwinula stevensoni]